MELSKKIFCIVVLSIMFFAFLTVDFVLNNKAENVITKVLSPVEFIIDNNKNFKINDVEVFDDDYTEKNKEISKKLGLTEDEGFIFGTLGKYWAKNLLERRRVVIKDNNLIYYRFGYLVRLKNSSFGIIDGKPANEQAFNRQLNSIRKGKFVILDLDTDISYPISKENRGKIKNFVVVRKNHVKNIHSKTYDMVETDILFETPVYKSGNLKIIVSDLTSKIKPDRDCSSNICREILYQINNAKKTIDMAIYGYSSTPMIEQALSNARKRGVAIRLVYDIDEKGENIYPDTFKFTKIIPNNVNDSKSEEVRSTMHNKFYIFDEKVVITGSANLSHTDMSGYNSNVIVVIENPKIAKFYTDEFEQMFRGVFHNDKKAQPVKTEGNMKIFFSPQDKAITNGVIPLIKASKKYIYIPAFVITEKRVTSELINAKQRGVDVRVILDALNASTKHSKHKELRAEGVLVKAENYAGKMHSKTMIIDDEYLIIGSMNFSNSGENKNDENMVILKDGAAAKFYKEFFVYQWGKIPDKWLKYTPRAEGIDSVGSCDDGLDNNYDGKTDKEDVGCFNKRKD